MKKFFTIIIFFTLFSCDESPYLIQDAQLLETSEKVQQELLKRGIEIDLDVNLIVKDTLRKTDGAWGLSVGSHTIYIDDLAYRTSVKSYSYRLEALLAHELGHNRLNLPHCKYNCHPLNPMNVANWQQYDSSNIDEMYDQMVIYINNN